MTPTSKLADVARAAPCDGSAGDAKSVNESFPFPDLARDWEVAGPVGFCPAAHRAMRGKTLTRRGKPRDPRGTSRPWSVNGTPTAQGEANIGKTCCCFDRVWMDGKGTGAWV
mmetsp:Transcript_1326/g.4455  ORF Transcript_1326/g.4455 Transcript_1326/m.4455 type:complete len:112 (+) Transcript_1326:1135-1470(+)